MREEFGYRDSPHLKTLINSTIFVGCVGGGYTDIPWSRPNGKGKYVPSDKSFLFSLHNPGRPAAKFQITKKLFAVSHHPDTGPVFGAGADLLICDSCDQLPDSYSNLPHSYDGEVSTLIIMQDILINLFPNPLSDSGRFSGKKSQNNYHIG